MYVCVHVLVGVGCCSVRVMCVSQCAMCYIQLSSALKTPLIHPTQASRGYHMNQCSARLMVAEERRHLDRAPLACTRRYDGFKSYPLSM